jgi:hypothetical protein
MEELATFTTVDRKIDRLLVSGAVEVATPNDGVLAAVPD